MASGDLTVAPPTALHEPYVDPVQQNEAATLGMWVFLGTEILLFGGLFLGYTAYRCFYGEAFHLGSEKTDYWLGTINTGVLIGSSLTIALALHACQEGKRRLLSILLLLTLILGGIFLGIKFTEYHKEFTEHLFPGPGFDYSQFPAGQALYVPLFFRFYFLMTGLHAIHLSIAMVLVAIMLVLGWMGRIGAGRYTPLELTALFWHLVDVVWVFLYPLLYLVGTRHA